MLEMYAPMVNSPITELATAIDDTQTTIEVVDGSKLPDAPNLAMIGLGENTETILYTQKDGNVLSGVTRGFQGIAKAWPQGTRVARFFAAYDQMAIQENIKTLDQSLAAHLKDKAPHVVPSAKVSSSLNLSIPNATPIALSFDTVKWDNDNIFVPTNPTRLTAKTAGKYLVWANLHFSPNENGNRHITLRKNGQGSQAFAQGRYRATVGSEIATVVFCAGIIDMAVNDYVEVIVYQDSGQSINIEVQAEYSPIFGMVRVG